MSIKLPDIVKRHAIEVGDEDFTERLILAISEMVSITRIVLLVDEDPNGLGPPDLIKGMSQHSFTASIFQRKSSKKIFKILNQVF